MVSVSVNSGTSLTHITFNFANPPTLKKKNDALASLMMQCYVAYEALEGSMVSFPSYLRSQVNHMGTDCLRTPIHERISTEFHHSMK